MTAFNQTHHEHDVDLLYNILESNPKAKFFFDYDGEIMVSYSLDYRDGVNIRPNWFSRILFKKTRIYTSYKISPYKYQTIYGNDNIEELIELLELDLI